MSKEEVIAIMVATFNEINKNMAVMSGMAEEDSYKYIKQNRPSI